MPTEPASNRPALIIGGAILVGCALIAYGLYAGLRASRSDSAQAALPTSASAASAEQRTPGAPITDEVVKRTTEEVGKALQSERSEWIEKCWKPLVAKEPQPAVSKHTLMVSISTEGREVGRGWSPRREAFRKDVDSCVRQLPFAPLAVTPPGGPVQVTIPVQFP